MARIWLPVYAAVVLSMYAYGTLINIEAVAAWGIAVLGTTP